MTKKFYVIYWEKSDRQRGFVSYDNPQFSQDKKHDEYNPVDFLNATIYTTKQKAVKTRDWYIGRGGFGDFFVMQFTSKRWLPKPIHSPSLKAGVSLGGD